MKCIVVGIAGGSGSGKTTLARRVAERLGEGRVLLFQHDAYYRDHPELTLDERARINYDHPDALDGALCVEQLRALKRGDAVEQPVYDFSAHRRAAETRRLEPRPVILVEGILVLADAALRAEMDLRVFADAPADLRLLRRLERDMTERGRSIASVRDQYLATVRPMHEAFVAPGMAYADLVVPCERDNPTAVGALADCIEAMLRGS
jgi:uridine kinase